MDAKTNAPSVIELPIYTRHGGDEFNAIMGDRSFAFPKPHALIEYLINQQPNQNAVVLDSFAGSGTTGHAVLEANRKDGGNRKFILVECEEYADTLTAERLRRVIQGYAFAGMQREELLNEKITWSVFEKKQRELLEKIDGIEALYGHEYDKIKKEIQDGVLTVTGERKITEKVPGLGGSFAFCRLGDPMDIEHLLSGESLPTFEALARYVFYTATGMSLEKLPPPSVDGFIGETDLYRVHLFYQPSVEWLRSNESALNTQKAEAVAKGNKSGKRAVVFATCKFMSQKELTPKRIEFCQLPYAIHRILGSE
jgi:adenine-specific DNA-methyltransferase